MAAMDKVLESRVSAEGRVSVPAELRQKLGLEPGSRVQFLIGDDGEIRLSTARALAEQVWSNNTGGGDAVDAGALVRTTREAGESQDTWSSEPFETDSAAEDALIASLFPEAP